MHPTGTQIAYLHLCHRKLWLFSKGITMEQTSELVAEGKLIDENSYTQRPQKWQEIAIENIRIDHFDAKLGIVREVKKSNKKESVHIAQLKYYLFVLERNGIAVNYGLLEYPKLRQTEEIWLTDADRAVIPTWTIEVKNVLSLDACPPVINKPMCKRCAYYEFCYVTESYENL